jgi:hypothetical protein
VVLVTTTDGARESSGKYFPKPYECCRVHIESTLFTELKAYRSDVGLPDDEKIGTNRQKWKYIVLYHNQMKDCLL